MKYNKKAIMKKAWEIKKENAKNIFSLCLKMAWAKDIREKMIAKLDLGSLLTARGELATDEVECLVGLIFSSAIGDYREKSNWAKKLNEKKNDCSASLDLYIQTESLKEMTLAEEAYRAMRLRTNRLYAEYVHELGLEFVSSLTKATDFIDRRRYV